MPINNPIPDSVIEYWKKLFKDFLAKFSGPRNKYELLQETILEG